MLLAALKRRITSRGIVVISGCAHAGVINTMTYISSFWRDSKVWTLIGGLHLFKTPMGEAGSKEGTLLWTIEKLRQFKIGNILGAHRPQHVRHDGGA